MFHSPLNSASNDAQLIDILAIRDKSHEMTGLFTEIAILTDHKILHFMHKVSMCV